MTRKRTNAIHLGNVKVGGGAPVVVQSMTNTDTRDVKATVAQIKQLEIAGCEVVRVAVLNKEAAAALDKIKAGISIPLVADIHFDHRLALTAIDKGVDGLRINPGNIGEKKKVVELVKAAKARRIPIRIGVNSGSLEKHLLAKYGRPTPEALVESAMGHIKLLEDLDFTDIKVSIKASDVPTTIDAYRLMSKTSKYPLHIGVTEAGTLFSGTVKSSVGLGILLYQGIGDTIRVSLTADPVEEVRVAWEMLKALKLRERGVNIISCPTCGRTQIDVIGLAMEVEKRLSHVRTPLDVAVMGCIVNGPGEASQADVGIAGGKGRGLLFCHGEVVKKLKEAELADALVAEVEAAASKKSS
ncbi:MAG: flavodoxin-dependent (E)-4-hydroxy-3-methylbut-2-enyl-diphosphate synthase [Nitrospirae bacterium]|nr:flavodoxin-dependent (E)-4-hydroxy-3-methylbut-2-enyl-diphosphate synthase [Nitrospirota bacterium]